MPGSGASGGPFRASSVRLADGTTVPISDLIEGKNNLVATTNPLVTDDSTLGYGVASRWVNLTSDEEFTCTDASVGAAVWKSTTGAGAVDTDDVTNVSNVNDAPTASDALEKLLAAVASTRGCVPLNDTDADHDINFGTGVVVGSDGKILEVASALVKRIDAAWAAGTAAGGLFSGAVAADTVYHLFVIRKNSDGSIDAGFDTSVTAANIPAGYTSFKRVGSVLTDEDKNILAFSAIETAGGGIEVLWLDPPLDVDAATSVTAVSRTLSVPTGYQVEARMNVFVDEDTTYWSSLDVNDEVPSITAAPLASIGDDQVEQALIFVRTSTSAQVRERSINGGFDVRVATLGWTDARRD